jgi:hypothetical protein
MKYKVEEEEELILRTDILFKRKSAIINKSPLRHSAIEILNYQTKNMDKERILMNERMTDQEILNKMREKIEKENKLKILVGNKENYLDDYTRMDLVKIYDGSLCSTYYIKEKEDKTHLINGNLKVKDVIEKVKGIFISESNKNPTKTLKGKPNKHSKSHFDFSNIRKRKSSETKNSLTTSDLPPLTTQNFHSMSNINPTNYSSPGGNEYRKMINNTTGKSTKLVTNKNIFAGRLSDKSSSKNLEFPKKQHSLISSPIKKQNEQALFNLPPRLCFNFNDKSIKKIKQIDYMSKGDFYYANK